MRQLLTISLFLVSVICYSQERYFEETTALLKSTILDSNFQITHNYSTNILLNPPTRDEYLIGVEKSKYSSFYETDNFLGQPNTFTKNDFIENKKSYFRALAEYSFDTTNTNVRLYTRDDSERIFDISYWKQDMDSTGHIIRHRTSSERDSLFKAEMTENWKDFNREFGECFVSYEIPIFNSDYTYCYFEWTFACQNKGQGISGLYKKSNGKWTIVTEDVTWDNE